jgi:hypothetical protein
MGGSSSPSEDPSVARMRKRQEQDLLQLDEDTNARVKRLMMASTGMRAFSGSPALRVPRGNSAGGPVRDYGLTRSNAAPRLIGRSNKTSRRFYRHGGF